MIFTSAEFVNPSFKWHRVASHGGKVISAAKNRTIDGKPIARQGDEVRDPASSSKATACSPPARAACRPRRSRHCRRSGRR
ncbi:PAAR domain-containing protein [Roseateles sp.]|uniref:PAAR domain-containing protein n=1 Tax=Roseateles sp. TaxID=1971397 RepID=UPI0039C9B77D